MAFDFEISLESDPTYINVLPDKPSAWQQVILTDSIFHVYPMMKVILPDETAVLLEEKFFVEGLKFIFKMGSWEYGDIPGLGFMQHNFFSAEQQVNYMEHMQDTIGGDVLWMFASDFKKQGPAKSFSYPMMTPDAIAKIIALQYDYPNLLGLAIPGINVFTTPSVNVGNWMQANYTDGYFLEILSKYAFNPAFLNSPWYVFFNLAGEFHFRAAADLFMGQQPVADLKFDVQGDPETDDVNTVLQYDLHFPGTEISYPLLNTRFDKLDKLTGTYLPLPRDISSTKLLPLPESIINKRTVLTEDLSDMRSARKMGMWSILEEFDYQGLINHQYKQAIFPYRMTFLLHWNYKLAAGKTINLQVSGADELKPISIPYSGKWLILESSHYIDEDNDPYTKIEVAKNTVGVLPDNELYFDMA